MQLVRNEMSNNNKNGQSGKFLISVVAVLMVAVVIAVCGFSAPASAFSIGLPVQELLNVKQPANLSFNVTNNDNASVLQEFTINVQGMDLGGPNAGVVCNKNGWSGSLVSDRTAIKCALSGNLSSGVDFGEHIQVIILNGITKTTPGNLILIDALGTDTKSVGITYLGLEMLALSFIVVIIQNIVFKKLSKQNVIKGMNDSIKHVQEEMKVAKAAKDQQKMNACLSRMNSLSMKKLQLTMKPNLLSSLVFILALGWMKARYVSMIVTLPIKMPVPAWQFPPFLITGTLGWFGWYLICAFAASFVVRDFLNIEI